MRKLSIRRQHMLGLIVVGVLLLCVTVLIRAAPNSGAGGGQAISLDSSVSFPVDI